MPKKIFHEYAYYYKYEYIIEYRVRTRREYPSLAKEKNFFLRNYIKDLIVNVDSFSFVFLQNICLDFLYEF